MPLVPPSEEGTWLAGRYLVSSFIGQDNYSTLYRAIDQRTGEELQLHEWTPDGAERLQDGSLQTTSIPFELAHRTRWNWALQAQRARGLWAAGITVPKSWEVTPGTAYIAYQVPRSWRPLSDFSGLPLPVVRLEATRLLNTLATLHDQGEIAGWLDPNTIWLDTQHHASFHLHFTHRFWCMQRTNTPRTPFTAPEWLELNAAPSPASDLFALGASLWYAVTGEPPGENLSARALLAEANDYDRGLLDLILHCLQQDPIVRPQHARQALAILSAQRAPIPVAATLAELDTRLRSLRALKPKKHECPGCQSPIEVATPSKRNTCLSGDAEIASRTLDTNRCAACRVGVLNLVENTTPLRICPGCRTGWLWAGAALSPWSKKSYRCEKCHAEFHARGDTVTVAASEEVTTWQELRAQSGRAEQIWCCDRCSAQFDVNPSQTWTLKHPDREIDGHRTLWPEEWARIAQGLAPSSGNAHHPNLDEEYDLQPGGLTLLAGGPSAWRDVYLPEESARWIAGGKLDGQPGILCRRCGLMLNYGESNLLRLVATGNSPRAEALQARLGASHSFNDWHAIARRLPLLDQIHLLEQMLDEAVIREWLEGELHTESIFSGVAHDYKNRKGQLTISRTGVQFKARLRRWGAKWTEIERLFAVNRTQLIVEKSNGDRAGFELEPAELSVTLDSGWRGVPITAADIADRCKLELKKIQSAETRR